MYSVRMRANRENIHISGAERVVKGEEIKNTALSLMERALSHERGKPDLINVTVEEIKTRIEYLTSLPVYSLHVQNVAEGKNTARRLLSYLGIPDSCIEKAFFLLENGDSMRGAIIMNMLGKRLEPDKERGIRVSRMDIMPEASGELERALSEKGYLAYFTHICEAFVLATKVASIRGNVAELCWSDDPFYTTGYVASKKLGYVRIPHMKNEGDSRGGRVFFVNDIELSDYIDEMEKTPVLVNKFKGFNEIKDIEDIIGEKYETTDIAD